MKGLKIVATGRCLPERVVTNQDMCKIVETSDEWIVTRTGVRERHHVTTEKTEDLAYEAARLALQKAGISKDQLCGCVVCTVSPDAVAPTVASATQARLGLPDDLPCFDMNAGCSGFIYGMQLCRGLLLQDERPYVLLIGAESLSQVTDFQDRSTCILFGDGAGAAVLTLDDNRIYAGIQGARGETIITIGGDRDKRPLIHMDGQAVFRFAVESFVRAATTLTQRTGLTLDQIDWFIPHQANRRIVEAAAKHLKQPMEKFYLNIDRYGNTSAASIPIAMDEMQEKGILHRGQKLLCAAFGSGLTWGGALLEF